MLHVWDLLVKPKQLTEDMRIFSKRHTQIWGMKPFTWIIDRLEVYKCTIRDKAFNHVQQELKDVSNIRFNVKDQDM